jgi:hypothetical protein
MTLDEIKNLKLGDVVQDLELLKNVNKEIYCLIVEVQEDRVYAIALKEKDKSRYPHVFRFNEIDCKKLSLPIENITKNIYDLMFNKFRSLEAFDIKAWK